MFHLTDEKMNAIARVVYDRHFELDPKLHTEYNDRRKRLMYEDILYNLSYIQTALNVNDEKIFVSYSVWLYQLLCNLMKDLDKQRIRDQMVLHYQILRDVVKEMVPEPEAQEIGRYLDKAAAATENQAIQFHVSDRFASGRYAAIRQEYLACILNNDSDGALAVVAAAQQSGIPIDDILVEILQEVMAEIGNLWHQNKIRIDQEHYCTAVTQVAIGQLHPAIFSKPRNGYKILTAGVGSELHEMGIRMVSDVFENNGWDSIFLGTVKSGDIVIQAIEENKPDLVGISVTMPQYLTLCRDIVGEVRKKYPDLKIAVGGWAFHLTNELWKQWNVDVKVEDAAQLVSWADQHIIKGRGLL